MRHRNRYITQLHFLTPATYSGTTYYIIPAPDVAELALRGGSCLIRAVCGSSTTGGGTSGGGSAGGTSGGGSGGFGTIGS